MTSPSTPPPAAARDTSERRQNPGRARPLSPDERRASLVAATLPLMAEHGPTVTTRQIAEAAGVAEGTIFRVFPDKDALIQAALRSAMDPAPLLEELANVDLALPLRARMIEVTTLLQRRLTVAITLMTAIGRYPPMKDVESQRAAVRPNNMRIQAAIARVLESDREKFRTDIEEVARLLRLLTFTSSHPMINEGTILTPDEIVTVLLDGLRRRPSDD